MKKDIKMVYHSKSVLICLLATFFVAGCSNDSNVIEAPDNGTITTPEDGTDKPVPLPVVDPEPGEEPEIGEPEINPEPEIEENCTTLGCPAGEFCYLGECVGAVEAGESCLPGVPCADGLRCVKKICTAWRQPGETCDDDDEAMWCVQDDVLCVEGICEALPKKGEACEGWKSNWCVQGTRCIDGVCVEVSKAGEACDQLNVCDASLVCADGRCVKPASMGEACDSATKPCVEGTVCQDHVCIRQYGECKVNSDCGSDSYCCLMDACETKNVCFPYGEGPGGDFDPECRIKMAPGVFEASVQCYWVPKTDTASKSVLNSVGVGKIHNKFGVTKPLITFVTTNSPNDTATSVLRIIHPETCEDIESIKLPSSSSYNHVSLADFDGDGYMELVVYNGSPTIYKWDESQEAHVPTVVPANLTGIHYYNGNFAIHDLDDDGVPEIIGTNGVVFHADGTVLSSAKVPGCSYTSPILGDLNGDGNVEFISNSTVYRWIPASNGWQSLVTVQSNINEIQAAYADFGTPDPSSGTFDLEHLDGRAEIVLAGGSSLQIWSIFDKDGALLPSPKIVMSYTFSSAQYWGYPPAIGDFNGDGKPEIGVASKSTFGVYDPKCSGPLAGKCLRRSVIWERATQDGSGIAGASAFDFDADGKIEIVYGDECYTRVYDGLTGEVLFSSYRNSGTVIEYPVIADVDDDGSTEIVISSDTSSVCSHRWDDSHRGVKCLTNEDCYSGTCVGGLCRCTNDAQCNWQTINNAPFTQYSCLAPLAGDEAGGNVCRAVQGSPMPGVTVLRDRLDRWASSRTLWNQHTYNITNIDDDGHVPRTSEWQQNFRTSGLNNYRQQLQGDTVAGAAPDITGRFTSEADVCRGVGDEILITAQVCNRGTKTVGSRMPAVFYRGSIDLDNILCVSYTDEMVPVHQCRDVSCTISREKAEQLTNEYIILHVNDDGKGGRTTVECDSTNNTDSIQITQCNLN